MLADPPRCPFLSFVIPVFNVEAYLGDCLDSILCQVEVDCEVILINDVSTDGSRDQILRYASRFPQVIRHVDLSKNSGVSAARNEGLRLAKGEYVWFVDADDVVFPGAVRTMRALAQRYPECPMFSFRFHSFSQTLPNEAARENGSDFAMPLERACKWFRLDRRRSSRAALRRVFYNLGVWRVLFKRSLVHDVWFPSIPNMEDYVFALAAFLRADTFVDVRHSLYGYRQRPGSASKKSGRAMLLSIFDATARMYNLLKQSPRWNWYRSPAMYSIRGCIEVKAYSLNHILPGARWSDWFAMAYALYREMKPDLGWKGCLLLRVMCLQTHRGIAWISFYMRGHLKVRSLRVRLLRKLGMKQWAVNQRPMNIP